MREDKKSLSSIREQFTLRSENELNITGFVEAAPETPSTAPLIVIVPTYAKTMRHYFLFSWYLLRHGFRVLRYDNTCHLGVSEGDIIDYTLRSAVADLRAVTNHVTKVLRPPSWGVVAPSLAFRVAIRALCDSRGPSVLFGLVGVVNLRYTLAQVTGTDFFQMHDEGRLPQSYNVLGHMVGCSFIESAAEDNLDSLESAVADLRRCSFPIVHIASENDLWVNLDEVQTAYEGVGDAERNSLYCLPSVRHDLSKNPVAASLALERMVATFSKYLDSGQIQESDVAHPDFLEIVRAHKLESAREKQGYRT